MTDDIVVRGASEHNLKDIDVSIPREEFTVVTGLSGSGKSSLAFETVYAEGQRRYIESLSAYARNFLGQMDKPQVENIEGLSPAISIDQKTPRTTPVRRSGPSPSYTITSVCCTPASGRRTVRSVAGRSANRAPSRWSDGCWSFPREHGRRSVPQSSGIKRELSRTASRRL